MWNLIYNPVPGMVQCTGNGLELHGNGVSLWEDAPKAWLGRRQEHFCCTAETELAFVPGQEGEEAGLTVYMNPGHHYEIARTMRDGVDCIILRRRIGALCAVEKAVPCHGGTVTLRLSCDRYWYRFALAERCRRSAQARPSISPPRQAAALPAITLRCMPPETERT